MMVSARVLRDAAPILLMLATAPALIFAAIGLESSTEDVRPWLPTSAPQRRTYDRFVADFGVDDIVVISWPGCTLVDERLQRLASALADPGAHGLATGLIRRIWTGPKVLEELTSPPLSLPRRQALGRLAGIFVGPDEQTTCAVVEVTEEGRGRRKDVIEMIRRAARDFAGLDPTSLRLGGNIYVGVTVDEEVMRSFRTLIFPSALVGTAIAWICLRNLRLIVVVLAASLYAQLLGLFIVRHCGERLNGLLIALPSLIFVLSVSGAIHLINYYRAAFEAGGPAGAAGRALAAGWLPCTLAALTTAAGMASLVVSEIETVRAFGLYCSAAIVGSLAILLSFVPAALDLWTPRRRASPTGRIASGRDRWALLTGWLARGVARHPRRWLAVCSAVTLLLGFGLLRLDTMLHVDKFFRSDSQIMRNSRWLEAYLGPLEQIEIVLRFQQASPRGFLDRMRLVAAWEEELRAIPQIRAIFSPATFLPPLPDDSGVRAATLRIVAASRVERRRQAFVEERYLVLHEGDELWRITLRVADIDTVGYYRLLEQTDRRIQQMVARQPVPGCAGVCADLTGIWPLFYLGQRLLLADLTTSYVTALLVISPMMMLAFRGIIAGALAMAPNVVPAVLVYGLMGWMRIPVDLGGVVTASIALGIAVDGTLHFVSWYQRVHHKTASRQAAIRAAFRQAAGAMTQTTVICGLAILVFSASAFLPTVRFAWLLFITLVIALAADLVLTPSLLASRLGRHFKRRRGATKISESSVCGDSRRNRESIAQSDPV